MSRSRLKMEAPKVRGKRQRAKGEVLRDKRLRKRLKNEKSSPFLSPLYSSDYHRAPIGGRLSWHVLPSAYPQHILPSANQRKPLTPKEALTLPRLPHIAHLFVPSLHLISEQCRLHNVTHVHTSNLNKANHTIAIPSSASISSM